MSKKPALTKAQTAEAEHLAACVLPGLDPQVEALINDLIGHIADKWTMLILELLAEKGELRFTRIGEMVAGISQKMLTQTLRQMERDGLLTRKVHPVVPPKVEYKLTPLGLSLGATFCGVWLWAEQNLPQVEKSRRDFDKKAARQAIS